jgi:uroporphyrinogen-III synthase
MEACSNLSIEWSCASLISTAALPIVLPEQSFDWIFFSSRLSVGYFFDRVPQYGHAQIAALGQATAKEVMKYAPLQFVGEPVPPQQVAKAFAQVVANSPVLFPITDISLRTVQLALKPDQCIDLICYKTVFQPLHVSACDLYVFSSPSNVDSFFSINQIPPEARILAFGHQTAAALHKKGCQDVQILDSVESSAIAHAIKQICGR